MAFLEGKYDLGHILFVVKNTVLFKVIKAYKVQGPGIDLIKNNL